MIGLLVIIIGVTLGSIAGFGREKVLKKETAFRADLKAIKRAEKALEELSENFTDWMFQEAERLSDLRDKAKKNSFSEPELDALFICAHDIKGQAVTLGYPYAGKICQSLCNLIEKLPVKNRIPPQLVDQHVDSVRAIVNSNIKSEQNKTAQEITKKLTEVTLDFLVQEKKIFEGKLG